MDSLIYDPPLWVFTMCQAEGNVRANTAPRSDGFKCRTVWVDAENSHCLVDF